MFILGTPLRMLHAVAIGSLSAEGPHSIPYVITKLRVLGNCSMRCSTSCIHAVVRAFVVSV